ncbi:unnamed protein product [Vitrella brassicaformis CCMP3155]|uniref:Uncharacterized protein n=1 Tax=Vitrella brassicaformis (strain CCMP3155) TaxID=1169540 RepID=A0A0G4H8L6_VITBC|nr:unnamed protein product [Vitrella brassicaformis CCMP3155]|eukprot:CEM40126.1 unnamed protein product [Vitrella brassicaformis CCMP3155]
MESVSAAPIRVQGGDNVRPVVYDVTKRPFDRVSDVKQFLLGVPLYRFALTDVKLTSCSCGELGNDTYLTDLHEGLGKSRDDPFVVHLEMPMPKDLKRAARREPSHAMPKDEISKRLEKKLKKTKSILTYREKVGMGYKTTEEKMATDLTAEELLDKRAKGNGDKFSRF